ncbi:hypothetical protein KAI04_05005 [Candidatus Pacearchaeota archaeon]|nr:hypothetical protein [Candidatus Pacearchaeota archaeon]
MTENYGPLRGEPKPPEEVDLERIVNILHKEEKFLEELNTVAYWKWRQPFTI